MRAVLVGLLVLTVASSACTLVAPAAQAATTTTVAKKKIVPPRSITRTALEVAGYCSSPSGIVTNEPSTIDSLKLTVTPASPRAGSKMTVKVSVQQEYSTPPLRAYPRGFLRGQVVIKVGTKTHVLNAPPNVEEITGAVFPLGWTAKGTFKAPAKGKRTVAISRVVYNVRGAFNGTWDTNYEGFDLVCSGGQNPITMATPYVKPRVTLKVRKHL